MLGLIRRYMDWLHTRWPAGTVEKLPEVDPAGRTSQPGVSISGDLLGVPLLKFALDSGARAARRVAEEVGPARADARASTGDSALDLAIIGAGVSGMAAAAEAGRLGLKYAVLEDAEPFSTLVNFPKAKPIFTYPRAMRPEGTLQVGASVKEALVAELRAQAARASIAPLHGRAERIVRDERGLVVRIAKAEPIQARRVLVAIGRSGDYRRLRVPGENLDKVYNRLHDPADFAGRQVMVVGGGDSGVEAAIALASAGAQVTLSCRGAQLTRPKPENIAKVTSLEGRGLTLALGTRVREIREREVVLDGPGSATHVVPNEVVFVMIGREAPLDFFRRSGIRIAGEMTRASVLTLALYMVFCAWLYNWESGGVMSRIWYQRHWFPTNLPDLLRNTGSSIAAAAADPTTLVGTIAISASSPSFWYTLAFSLVVVIFGVRRIRRRRTPYVTAQTLTLMAVQVFPLFLFPEIILPQMNYHGLLPQGVAEALFPVANYGHGREFWRAYGLILAWPLNVYNIFTHQPLWWWIAIGFVQTCVLIPLGIHFFGKGFYCGWICSCGALAETLGDTHRHKMPHGPRWNRLDMAGQGVLAVAVLVLLVRIAGWVLPAGNWADAVFDSLFKENYKWWVDVFLAGVVGYGLYFWYSGRVWCRFFCPLAALMHVYARFSRFAIVAEKKKCISCNVCTSICHQGIDVMNFANKGLPMQDPECVRCSACVHACPTGVLRFGQVRADGSLISVDSLMASPVLMREGPEPA